MAGSSLFVQSNLGAVPLCGKSFEQIITEDFVNKFNPVVFGPLDMTGNKIINLAAGSTDTDAANVSQAGGGGGTTSTSVGIATSQLQFLDVSPFRINITSIPPALRLSLPSNTDLILALPGFASESCLPTFWTKTENISVLSLAGYNLGPMSQNFPLGNITFNCTFAMNASSSASISALLVLYKISTSTVTGSSTSVLGTTISGSYSINFAASFSRYSDILDSAIALRFSIPTGATLSINTFEVVSIFVN